MYLRNDAMNKIDFKLKKKSQDLKILFSNNPTDQPLYTEALCNTNC